MTEADLSALLISLLSKTPGVVQNVFSGRANFTIRDKIFAFTRKDGVALKLPAAHIDQLIAEDRIAGRLVMGKRAMNEWAMLSRSSAAEYRRELPLLRAALAFVESEAARAATRPRPAKKAAKPRPVRQQTSGGGTS